MKFQFFPDKSAGKTAMLKLRRHQIAAALFILAGIVVSSAHADSLHKMTASCVSAFVDLRINRMADLSNHDIHWHTADGKQPVDLKFGDSVGAGFFGRVYDVAQVDDPALIQGYHGRLVAKLGHLRGDENVALKEEFLSKRALQDELTDYQDVTSRKAQVVSQAGYPKHPAWGDGLPITPIVSSVETDHGWIVFKPRVKGRSVSSFHSLDDLTDEMRSGLKDIMDYAHAVDRVVPGGFSTDLRPPNLVWIEDPEMLHQLGYNRPGWLLFEQSRTPLKSNYYSVVGFDNYLQEFSGYMKGLAPGTLRKANAWDFAVALGRAKGNIQGMVERLNQKLGPIFSMHSPILKKDYFFVSDPEVIRQVLMDTDRNAESSFVKSGDQQRSFGKIFGDNNLFSAPLEEWRPQRKQLAPAFAAKEVARPDYAKTIEEVFMKRIGPLHDGPVNFKDMLHETTLDVILHLLFNYQPPAEDLSLLAKGLKEIYQVLLVEGLNPFQKPLHGQPNLLPYQRRNKELFKAVDRVIENIISHSEENPGDARGFMGLLMSMRDPNKGPITRREMRDQILTFLFAGHETTAHTLTWAFHDISENPQIQKKLTDLIRHGDKAEAEAYIDQIWSEALRLHMPITFLPRDVVKDVELATPHGPLHVSKGSTVVLNNLAMQRRPEIWGVEKTGYPATEFHPERFSPENQKKFEMAGKDDFKNYAFGGGPRFCIGASLASVEAKTILFQFFKKFDAMPVHPGVPPKISALNDALLEPHVLKVKTPAP